VCVCVCWAGAVSAILSTSVAVWVTVCTAGNAVPVNYMQPSGYGQPASMVGYQQSAVMGTWQPGVMGMQATAPPPMMAAPVPSAAYVQPRPPMGYVQQPMGMQAPAGYAPATFGTSLQQ